MAKFIDVEVTQLQDYPPKISISFHPPPFSTTSPKLDIEGLDITCGFDLVGAANVRFLQTECIVCCECFFFYCRFHALLSKAKVSYV